MKIFIDGTWLLKEEAKLSVFDHGVLYGDGVFEGIRAYDGHVFRLRDHMDRLYRSAGLIELAIPYPLQDLETIVKEALAQNRLSDAYIRLLVTRGVGDLGLDPRACPKPSVVVIADKLALFPERCYKEGLEAVIAKTRRNLADALDPTIKSMNYLNNILAKIEANKHGVPEAIMLNSAGLVSECTGDNVFLVKNGEVWTPPVSAGVLEGITRKTVMEIVASRRDLAISERDVPPDHLFAADEVFFTGTAAEVIPVTKIDNRPIGSGRPGAVTVELMKAFKDLIRQEQRNANS